MPITLAVDLGTTTITALALDLVANELVAVETLANDATIAARAELTQGRSEWDAERIVTIATRAVRAVAAKLGSRAAECLAIGVTGQQHGMLLIDDSLRPLSPLIGWQDRRALEICPSSGETYLEEATARLGPGAAARHGCRLASGYMGATLYWLARTDELRAGSRACFLPDLFAARLAEVAPATDPSMAASAGLVDLATRDWNDEALAALELPRALFPPVRESDAPLGSLSPRASAELGLPENTRVCVPIGDNQAAFAGCVADRESGLLVNVGTGGQVAAYSDLAPHAPPLETRPFPFGGNLLAHAGLCGGRSIAALEQFFRLIASEVSQVDAKSPIYARLEQLAAAAPSGAGGLVFEPLFGGTRAEPNRRAAITELSFENFTPGHVARALLEGMARTFAEGHGHIRSAAARDFTHIVGGGNGLRENRLLARLVSEALGLPIRFPKHREEAASGAARLAARTVGHAVG